MKIPSFVLAIFGSLLALPAIADVQMLQTPSADDWSILLPLVSGEKQADIRAAHVNLGANAPDAYVIYYISSGWCGSGGCTAEIAIKDMTGKWIDVGEFSTDPKANPDIGPTQHDGMSDIKLYADYTITWNVSKAKYEHIAAQPQSGDNATPNQRTAENSQQPSSTTVGSKWFVEQGLKIGELQPGMTLAQANLYFRKICIHCKSDFGKFTGLAHGLFEDVYYDGIAPTPYNSYLGAFKWFQIGQIGSDDKAVVFSVSNAVRTYDINEAKQFFNSNVSAIGSACDLKQVPNNPDENRTKVKMLCINPGADENDMGNSKSDSPLKWFISINLDQIIDSKGNPIFLTNIKFYDRTLIPANAYQ